LATLNRSVSELNSAIAEHDRKLKGFENIINIKGIGDKSAAILLSVIG
jgi:transposase